MRGPADILYNFHWIVPGEAARSAQAYAGFLAPFLRRHGIRSVVNLRGQNLRRWWWHYESRICAGLGIPRFDLKINSRQLPTRAMLTGLFEAFDTAPRPMLIKCSGGQDRTSLAAALYLVHREGWGALDKAMAQYSGWPYLHRPKKHQRWLRQFPLFAREASEGAPLATWIAQSYRPEDFAAWLKGRGMGRSFRKIYGAAKP